MKKNFFYFLLLTTLIFNTNCFAVTEDDEIIDVTSLYQETIQTTSNESNIPTIYSRYSVVYERNSKTVLYEKNKDTQTPMASTTKIMTAIIVIENADLSQTVTISSKAAGIGGSRLGLSSNAKITIKDLLYGLMLCSGNDAAIALAETVSGSISDFAELMNNKACELGLKNTSFVTPHGLDSANHYTTAYELALLADYALQNKTFSNIVNTKTYTVTINGYPKTISNTNELLGNINGVYGVKTGFTNGANRCLVSAAKRGNLDIICVVLGADTKKIRTQDSIKLIEYCFNIFETIDISKKIDETFEHWKNENISCFNINKGITSTPTLYLEKPKNTFITVKKVDLENLDFITNIEFNYKAPLLKDTTLRLSICYTT